MKTIPPINLIPHGQYQAPVPSMMGFVPSHGSAFAAVKPSKRGVSFAPTVRVKTVSILSRTPEDKSRLYYTKSDLNGFYLEAKEFRSLCNCSSIPPRQCLVRLEADPAIRGLELIFFPIRARNKTLARKNLLTYYKALNANRSMTDEQKVISLAAASAKVSQWSKLVARETARLDSIRAHGCSIDHHHHPRICAPKTVVVENIPAIKRRTVSFDDDDSQPSKRRRV